LVEYTICPSSPERRQSTFRCKIVEAIIENEGNLEKEPGLVKFRCSVNNEEYKKLLPPTTLSTILNDKKVDRTMTAYGSSGE
jgi:hypothetical protein